jgi:predicted nucleic acid-binding protein
MEIPPLVVLDTSAVIEVLVREAPCHEAYLARLIGLRGRGFGFAYCDLLELELLEAAYTWDLRRGPNRAWRQDRRRGAVPADRNARELDILGALRAFLGESPVLRAPARAVADDAAEVMHETALASYDAAHVALATVLDAPIVTHDRRMAEVALRWVPVLTER